MGGSSSSSQKNVQSPPYTTTAPTAKEEEDYKKKYKDYVKRKNSTNAEYDGQYKSIPIDPFSVWKQDEDSEHVRNNEEEDRKAWFAKEYGEYGKRIKFDYDTFRYKKNNSSGDSDVITFDEYFKVSFLMDSKH